jgi:hypothetical protein
MNFLANGKNILGKIFLCGDNNGFDGFVFLGVTVFRRSTLRLYSGIITGFWGRAATVIVLAIDDSLPLLSDVVAFTV